MAKATKTGGFCFQKVEMEGRWPQLSVGNDEQ